MNAKKVCVHWGTYKSELVMSYSMRLFDNLGQKDIRYAVNEGTDSCYLFL